MHFVVKALHLAQMYNIPNQVNLAILPSQISPVGVVAAISKMAAMSPLSQELRGLEPS